MPKAFSMLEDAKESISESSDFIEYLRCGYSVRGWGACGVDAHDNADADSRRELNHTEIASGSMQNGGEEGDIATYRISGSSNSNSDLLLLN